VVLKHPRGWRPVAADDALKLRAFTSPNRSPLQRVAQAVVRRLRGDVLDIGCGGGGLYDRRDIIGLDINLAMARAFGEWGLVADAGDPPFAGRAFDAVLLFNVLDACPYPRLVLAQADALLRPGGTLVVSCPYAWTGAVPARQRFGPRDLVAGLRGRSRRVRLRGRYRITRQVDRVAWRLPVADRIVHEYACQFIVANKVR
jgi:SAM-dependent methyltransferase